MKKISWSALGVLSLIAVITELSVPHDPEHAAYWWNSIPGFYAAFGFVGCVAIIVISKWIGKILLQRGEEYYE